MIGWNDSLSTGVKALDAQHKVLIQKFNELAEALSKPGRNREVAESVLDYLQFYAEWHFTEEEKYMEQANFPGAADNLAEHAEFRRRFRTFYERWQAGTMTSAHAVEIHDELAIWIVNHILKTDAPLRQHLGAEAEG
jgi:hemerythrin